LNHESNDHPFVQKRKYMKTIIQIYKSRS